ncbi:MAG: CBS domain-containing protein [Deltaproteobacteria bacterium]|nr:CBS domain-containing protein [Deltaproteobacteria bacterium]
MPEEYRIDAVMTPCPHTINAAVSLNDALQVMSIRKLRHLPVVSDGELVGVLCEREVKALSTISENLRTALKAGDFCDRNPYIVQADIPLSKVAYDMSLGKQDYALITDGEGHFLGIFTTTDACRAIHMILGK